MSVSVYVGAYIELYEREFTVDVDKDMCVKCGQVYTNGEKFCSKDGSPVQVHASTKTIKVERFYDLVREFPDELGDYEGELYSTEYLPGILMSNNIGSYLDTDGCGYGDRKPVMDIYEGDISKSLNKFKTEHKTVLGIMSKIGIKFSIKYGAISYWS